MIDCLPNFRLFSVVRLVLVLLLPWLFMKLNVVKLLLLLSVVNIILDLFSSSAVDRLRSEL